MSERRFRTQVKQNNQVYHDLESAWSVLLASFRLGSYVLVPCNNRYFARKPVFIEFLQIFDKCGLTLLTHIHLMILKISTWQNGLVYSLGCISTHGNKPIFPFSFPSLRLCELCLPRQSPACGTDGGRENQCLHAGTLSSWPSRRCSVA